MTGKPPAEHRSKTQLAQLVGEALIHAAPHTAKTNTDETFKQLNDWLDGLEAHTASFVAPFLAHIQEHGDPPEPVKALLAEAIAPTAAFSATIEQIALFSILSQIISTATTPFLQGLQNNLYGDAVGGRQPESAPGGSSGPITYQVPDGNDVARPVDPSVIATATGRGLNLGDPPTVSVADWAYKEAGNQGIDAHNLNLMASIIGLPPALQELFEMVRRGVITADGAPAPSVDTGATPATGVDGKPLTVEQGLREGDFRDDWIQAAVQLRHAFLTPLDFVNAAVREQMDYETARAWAHVTGLDWDAKPVLSPGASGHEDDMFGLAFSIAGRPPGPEQLAVMTHRGILPATGPNGETLTFDQGIAESDVKTKWSDPLFKVSAYVPPPRMIAGLYQHGALTAEQAQQYWEFDGVPTELAAAFLHAAQQEIHQQERLLAKGDILKGYYDGIFSNATATDLLAQLGYVAPVSTEMLELQDFRRQIQAIDSVVRKIATMYQTFRISATDALAALADLGISQNEANALLHTWDEIRIRPLRVPTTSEIGRAVKAGTITEQEGLQELANLGYQARDAAIVLSSESGAAVTPLPPAGTTTTG